MAVDAEIGNNSDLLNHLDETIKTLKKNEFKSKFEENDLKYLEIIHSGRNSIIDLSLKGLQVAVKKRGGLVASYCNTGGEEGLMLTRAAFSVMLKFAGL